MALRNSILFGILAATAVIAKGPDSHRWRRQATTVTVTAPAETVTVTATNTVTVTAAAGPHPTGGANPTDGATTLPAAPGEEDCDDDPAMTHSANPDSTTIQQHDNGTPAGSATSALPDLAPGNTTIPGQAAANPSAVPDQAPANTTIPGQAASNVSTPISDVTAAGDEAGQIEEPAQVWGVTTSSTPGTNPTGAVDANAGNGTGNPGAAGNPAAPDAAGNTNTPDAAGNTTGAPDAAGNATTPVTPSDNATIPGNTSDNATTTPNTPSGNTTTPTGDGKHDVFAHYMLGIVAGHTAADWEKDFAFAQQYGVSAFGLNFGNVDSYTDAQLDLAYAAAEKTGFKVFMSFDFAYYKVDNPDDLKNMADKIKKYGAHAGQYLVDGKPLVSSFMGDTMDWSAVASAAGMEIAAMPNTNNADASATKGIAGFLSWEP